MSDRPFITNAEAIDWDHLSKGDRFERRRKQLASAAGGVELGCSLYEVPPGKAAWPQHMHFGNEEAIYVLEGRATLRIGDEEFAVEAGQWCALHADSGRGHQLFNSSEDAVRYLCVSTMEAPDFMYYPDSDKFTLFSGAAPGGDGAARTVSVTLPRSAAVDYWQGEVDEVAADLEPPRVERRPKPDVWPPIASIDDVDPRDGEHGRIKLRGWRIGAAAGSRELACSVFQIEDGHRSFPRHAHLAIEESVYVLEGTGQSIRGDIREAIGPGDYVVYPAGPDHAHTIEADPGSAMTYLCFSTVKRPDVILYPDSRKVGVSGDGVHMFLDRDATLGYWDREPES